MKVNTLTAVLICANLLLVFQLWNARRGSVTAAQARSQAGAPRPSSFKNAVPPPGTAETTGVITNEFRWGQLESEDYPTYILRLRGIGCPEQTIRDIIIADLDKLMAPRVSSLEPTRP